MAAPKKDTAASAAKPTRKPKQADTGPVVPDPTHEVVRALVLNGTNMPVGSLVHLSGLNASELESHGYVRKI